MLGQRHLRSITVRVKDDVPPVAAEGHRAGADAPARDQDFFVFNTDAVRKTIERTTATMTLLVSMIALISLMVGGIGVMNIMLVSVTERTREIGVRMAVGARRGDIMQQFLIEAVLVCLIGGMVGIALSLGLGVLVSKATGGSFRMIYSSASMVAAFTCSTLIGVLFGYLPARNAARLDPVEALAGNEDDESFHDAQTGGVGAAAGPVGLWRPAAHRLPATRGPGTRGLDAGVG